MTKKPKPVSTSPVYLLNPLQHNVCPYHSTAAGLVEATTNFHVFWSHIRFFMLTLDMILSPWPMWPCCSSSLYLILYFWREGFSDHIWSERSGQGTHCTVCSVDLDRVGEVGAQHERHGPAKSVCSSHRGKAHRGSGRHRSQSSDRAGVTSGAQAIHVKEGFNPFSL